MASPRFRVVSLLALLAVLVGMITSSSKQALADPPPTFNLALNIAMLNALSEPALDPIGDPPSSFKRVRPSEFDPARTRLVQAAWLTGIGCPTGGFTTPDGSTRTPYTDGACPTGDPSDKRNTGLLLAKTGPTSNVAAALAQLTNVRGMTLTELGYDLRKPNNTFNPTGSHCGAGAPRFNVVTMDGTTHVVGCNSPTPLVTNRSSDTPLAGGGTGNNGWIRLRWNAALLLGAFPPILPTDVVKRIVIVFDEGQDTGGPDLFGAAILDNIDVNGTLVGRGNSRANDDHEESENDD
jgi:hypothetical protein